MKKIISILLILGLLCSPAFAVEEGPDDLHPWYVQRFVGFMDEDQEAWNKATVLGTIREMINRGYITEDDILEEFGGQVTAAPTSTPVPTPVPTSTPKPTNTTGAYLEILSPVGGYDFTLVGKDFYSVGYLYDDIEEEFIPALWKNNKVVHEFPDRYAPNGIVQIDGVIYLSFLDKIYKYSGGKFTTVTDKVPGVIHEMTTNGKDLFVVCDDDSYSYQYYLEASYYKVTTSGTVTHITGQEVAVGWNIKDFAVNKDGDRLARIPFNDDGIKVRRMDGTEYFQRDAEEDESHVPINEYLGSNVLYYNNCLIANVNGSLVYYDEKNVPRVLLGDLCGRRSYNESRYRWPNNLLPIQTGAADKVDIGFITNWFVGDDGCIYGITEQDLYNMYIFKLTIPDSVKKTNTYKKVSSSAKVK